MDISVPGGGGRLAGLQGFLLDRVQQRRLSRRSLTFPVEVFKGSRPGQGSPASSSFHSPAASDDDADEPGEGVVFALSPS